MESPDHIKNKYDTVQYTLVDCPGHASLIRTIIGGAQIIDLMILVIDIVKGVQTQTAECLGMISHKKSPMTIFGHKHKIKNFIKKFNIFHEKVSMAFGFWFIFEIKLLILK